MRNDGFTRRSPNHPSHGASVPDPAVRRRTLLSRLVLIALTPVLVGIGDAAPATAQIVVATDAFTVRTMVGGECTIQIGDLYFGTISPNMLADVDAATSGSVECDFTAQILFTLDAGTGGSGADGSSDSRSMIREFGPPDPDDVVLYYLYADEERTIPIGVAEPFIIHVAGGVAAPTEFTIFGRIPQQNIQSIGRYLSTVTATVGF